jgi:hypothetical protein
MMLLDEPPIGLLDRGVVGAGVKTEHAVSGEISAHSAPM